jgi:ABC-2 type transport system permease protein
VIRRIHALVVKELQVLWQDRPALALLFVMPAFFIVVMSFALDSVFEAGTERHPLVVLTANDDDGPVAARVLLELRRAPGIELVTTWEGAPLNAARAEELVGARRFPIALVLPAGLSRQAAGSEGPAVVSLIVDPATSRALVAPVRGAVEGVLRGAVLVERMPRELRAALERWAAEQLDGPPPGDMLDGLERTVAERLRSVDAQAFAAVSIEHPRDTAMRQRPTATQQSVPAYTIFGVFFIALTLATSFVRERADGTMTRLRISPLSGPALLFGKLLPYYLVNLAQIAAMFAVGVMLFGVELGDPVGLLAVSLALAAASTGLGLLIATFGHTEAQVGALAVSSSITLAALGGMMVPAFVMPGAMQRLALCTPHSWALAGYHDVMLRGAGLGAVMPSVLALLGFAAAFFIVAALRFRFR